VKILKKFKATFKKRVIRGRGKDQEKNQPLTKPDYPAAVHQRDMRKERKSLRGAL